MSYQDICALTYSEWICNGQPSLALALLAGLDDDTDEGPTWTAIRLDIDHGYYGIPSFDA